MKKQKNSKIFTASNGEIVEYFPDGYAAKPLDDQSLQNAKTVDINSILSQKQQQAVSEFTALKTKGRPRKNSVKVNTTFRLEPEVVAGLKSFGKGWHGLVNGILKDWVGQHQSH